MSTPQTQNYAIDLRIGDIDRNFGDVIRAFEWKATVNGGFIVRIKLIDHGFDLLTRVFTKDFFETARQGQKPTIVQFRIGWPGSKYRTPWRTALISDIDCRGGSSYSGIFEFVALDPISFHINNGNCAGKVYKGPIGGDKGVIMQVLDDYLPDSVGDMSLVKNVTDTTDAPAKYWMMRQDPKTFIMSLLDWSSSLTPSKTSWIVANGEDEDNLYIKIEESYTPTLNVPSPIADQTGPLLFRFGGRKASLVGDIIKWEMLHDSFLVVLNTKLLTSGISAVSGQYLDKVSDHNEEFIYVKDDNTEKKVNPTFGSDRGYTKPGVLNKGFTHIMAVPEFNAGDIGKKYGEWIDGRARQIYMDMLNMVMRIKITVTGEPRLFDCTDLGRCYVTLKWLGVEEDKAKFMDGNWLLYGWHHKCLKNWQTDIYLARLDFDAAAIPGQS